MRILFVADGRSPISQNWIRYFVDRGDEVYLASTFFCELGFPVKQLEFTPVAFSAVKKPGTRAGSASSRGLGLRTLLRQWLGPLTIPRSAQKLQAFIHEVQPDLIHALRVPYEGMLTSQTKINTPWIVSVWGNDFTLHARSTPLMKAYTRRVMKRVSALHADCQRDIRLAREWGLSVEKPTLVAPGNGGIRPEVFYPPASPVRDAVIINPRGFRAYVRNESFFKSIPLILTKRPDAKFIFTSMQGETQAVQWIRDFKIEHAVQLLAPLSHEKMGGLFRSAQIVVSPSVHDGTPNSLIEAMACGCFPIAGDLESIREWITPGQNGLLVNPNDPHSIANAVLLGLEREDLRRNAAGLNADLISAHAEYETNMQRVLEFYQNLLKT